MTVDFSFYDAASGEFADLRINGDEATADMNCPAGFVAIRGLFDRTTQRVNVETGAIVNFVPDAPPDTELETWAWSNKHRRWLSSRTLLSHQLEVKDRLAQLREAKLVLPVAYGGTTFDADEKAIRNLNGWLSVVNAGEALPEGFAWTDADNVEHPADGAFLQGLAAAIALRGTLLYVAYREKRDAVMAMTDIATVQAYDVNADWP